MSTTTVGNKVYKNIDDLPLATSLSDGDKILIQTKSGTSLIDYYNVKIDLDHTTFQSVFNEMISFNGTVSTFVAQMTESFNTISSDFESIKASFTEMQGNFEGMKFLAMAMCGAFLSETAYLAGYNAISPEAKTFVDAVLAGINEYIEKYPVSDGVDMGDFLLYERNLMLAQMNH